MKKILIYGAGSIGIYLGTKLFAQGHDVTLCGRNKLKLIKNKILINEIEFKVPNKIFNLDKDIVYDQIYITCKLYDSEKILNDLKNLNYSPKLIFIQNGIFSDFISEEFKSNIVSISVFEGVDLNLKTNSIIIKESKLGWQISNLKPNLEIFNLLKNAKININLAENDLNSLKIEKLILNCGINGLSVIEEKNIGDLISDKKIKNKIILLMKEAYSVLKNEYKLKPFEIVKENILKTLKSVPEHYTSTYRDYFSGKKTEVPFLNGFIVELGKKYNINTENNLKLCNYFKELENTRKNEKGA